MEDNTQNFISYSDFQKYSEHLSEIITDLQSAIANYKNELNDVKDASRPTQSFDSANVDNSQIADLIAKVGELEKMIKRPTDGEPCISVEEAPAEEKVSELEAKVAEMEEEYSNLKNYTKYLAETLDKSITHQDYIADEANKVIEHNNYLAENMNKMIGHQDYLAEKMNQMIDHQDYLAENLNDTISYQNYVAEMLDKSIDYSNMLAEEQNKTVAHADYLAEKMNQMVNHQDYLAENMNNMISHQDYIVEEVNKMGEGLIEENSKPEVEEIKESKKSEKSEFDSKKYQSEINEKLSTIISEAKERYAEEKRREAEAIEESRNDVETKNFSLINYMPARLSERWSKLSDERKQEILAESKMFVINNAASAEYFWNTRDMRDKKVELQKLEESKVAQSAPVVENAISDERLQSMKEKIQRNMRRF